MSPIEVYRIYVAIKLHFTSNYDAIKYQFRVNVTDESFFRRRDRYFFEKIARKYPQKNDLVYFFVAQFLDEVDWVGEMADSDGHDRYIEMVGRMSRSQYTFSEEMKKLFASGLTFDELFIGTEDKQPHIVRMLASQDLSRESFVLANRTINFSDQVLLREPLIWPQLKDRMLAYQPFVPYNRGKCMKVLTDLVKGINSKQG